MRAMNKVYSSQSQLIHENAIFIRLKVMVAQITKNSAVSIMFGLCNGKTGESGGKEE